MSRLFKTVCVAALLSVAPLASVAADPVLPASIAVRSSDLDLATVEGAQTMLRRIERAAERVCGQSVAQRYPATRRAFETCRRATIASAVDGLNAPLVESQPASSAAL